MCPPPEPSPKQLLLTKRPPYAQSKNISTAQSQQSKSAKAVIAAWYDVDGYYWIGDYAMPKKCHHSPSIRGYIKTGKNVIRREPSAAKNAEVAPKRHPTLAPESRITPYTDAIKPNAIGLTKETRVRRETSVVHDNHASALLTLLLHIYPSSAHRFANFLNQLPLFAGPALASRPSKVRTGPPFSYPA